VDRVEEALRRDAPPSERLRAVRTGLAFSAARGWNEPPCRRAAGDLLVRPVPLADAPTARAVMGVFCQSEVLLADGATRELLEAIYLGPDDLLLADAGPFFVERLVDVLSAEREAVCCLCERLVRLRAEELRASRTHFPSAAESQAAPFGISDVARSTGYVVGTSNITPAYAVSSIARW
jgi:hypothetical protein